MRVLYVQSPESMVSFFTDYYKDKPSNSQSRCGGLRNTIGNTYEHVISTGKTARLVMSPKVQSNVTLIDPNRKSVNQAKEEINREDQVIIPVTTGTKRKGEGSTSKSKKARKIDGASYAELTKNTQVKKKPKSKPKTALSM